MGWWVAGGWVDKKCGSELGEWRKGRRGGVVGKREEVAVGSWEISVIDWWWAAMFPLRLWAHYNIFILPDTEYMLNS